MDTPPGGRPYPDVDRHAPTGQTERVIRVHAIQDEKLREGGVALALHPGPRWIDVEAPTAEEVAWLGETFSFHPLALEDCLHLDQRPKLEDYPNSLFVVVHSFTTGDGDCTAVELHELHAFLAKDLLVTVHTDRIPACDAVKARLQREPQLLVRGPDLLLHAFCDGITDAHLPLVDRLHEEIEALEEKVFEGPDPRTLERIFAVKRSLLTLRRTLAPAREVYVALSRPGDARVSEKAALYFRDVWDHVQRLTEAIDAAREMVGDVVGAYHSELANRTNVVMQRLALFSAILLPLTFITGFFGQNFLDIPYGSHALMLGSLVAMLVAPVATVLFFRFKGWL